MHACRWVRIVRNMTVGVAVRLPAAVLSVFLVVVAAGLLGPTWGLAVILGWLALGLLALTGPGEQAIARTVLRYQPAPGSWLAADVSRLAPGRRIDVYVARGTSGVFAVGGRSVAIGAWSLGDGSATPALRSAAAAAVADLQLRRTRPELTMLWWAGPWMFAKLILSAVLGRRLTALLRVLAVIGVSMSILISAGGGQPVAAGLGVGVLADISLSYAARARQRTARRGPVPTLAPV